MDMGFDDSHPGETGDAAGRLRPLGWRELCARLAAAQDLRREVSILSGLLGRTGERSKTGGGSFHHPAAMLLQGGALPEAGLELGTHQNYQAEGRVNPSSSTNGKHAGGTNGTMQGRTVSAPRPEQSRRELP